LFGICLEKKPYLLITQFHGTNGGCLTLAKAIRNSLITSEQWIAIFKETADGLQYVHSKHILHNDIKGDNVVLTNTFENSKRFHPVLIDFGKSCTTGKAKRYILTYKEQHKYYKHHWHIAPELINGTQSQSFASDVYSLGALMSHSCKVIDQPNQILYSVSQKCMHCNPKERPYLNDIRKTFTKAQHQ